MLAEQMVFAQSIMLESWAAGVISLARFELACRYHLWTLLAGWSCGRYVNSCELRLGELQKNLQALNRREARGRN